MRAEVLADSERFDEAIEEFKDSHSQEPRFPGNTPCAWVNSTGGAKTSKSLSRN